MIVIFIGWWPDM